MQVLLAVAPRLGLLTLVATLSMAGCTALQNRAAEFIVEDRLAASLDPLFERPGLQVFLCGSSGPLGDPDRAAACVGVIAGGKFYLIDAGAGSAENLMLWQVPMNRLGGVLLTHFHSDHITELGEFNLQSWVTGRDARLPVFGPQGVEKVVEGFNGAYELSRGYRTAHHGADFLDPDVGLLEARPFGIGPKSPVGSSVTVLERDGLTVRAFAVDHAPVSPAVAYRFDYEGRSVFVTGDANATPIIAEAARGADVLVHDAMAKHLIGQGRKVAQRLGLSRPAHIMGDIPTYHASAVDAARVANDAGARVLVLYHLVPPPTSYVAEQAFLQGVDDVRSDNVVLGSDGLLLTLPPRSDVIEESRLGG